MGSRALQSECGWGLGAEEMGDVMCQEQAWCFGGGGEKVHGFWGGGARQSLWRCRLVVGFAEGLTYEYT